METGVATRPIADFAAYHEKLSRFVYRSGFVMKPIFDTAKSEHAKEPKRLWVVPGADHGKYLDAQPEEYRRTVMGFLDGVFLGR